MHAALQQAAGQARVPSSRCSCSCRPPQQPHLAAVVPARSTSRRWRCSAANGASTDEYERVADAMTTGSLFACSPDDTVDAALEMLVEHRITGLPVVDSSNRVVGVVSDYDLLALDKLGQVKDDRQLFPQADQTWQAFKEVKRLLAKSSGKKVCDVMTATPITVRPETGLEEAATLLLAKKIHRLPVVDGQGTLVGVLSRGNLVKAALAVRKAAAAQSSN